jgi:hypothetical protein
MFITACVNPVGLQCATIINKVQDRPGIINLSVAAGITVVPVAYIVNAGGNIKVMEGDTHLIVG